MDMSRRLARAVRLWNDKEPWTQIVRECWDYFQPHRRAGEKGRSKRTSQKIFDMTGPNSARQFPGELQRLIMPVGQRFDFEAGPLVSARLKDDERKQWNHQLAMLAGTVYPYFATGSFDHAVYEAFTDLLVTNGYIMPLRGPSIEQPLKFVCLPTDEVAVEYDMYGDLQLLNWRREVRIEQVVRAYPRGAFTKDQRDLASTKPDTPVTVYQDFERQDDYSWSWCIYLDKSSQTIASDTMRRQPVAALRFYVTPGDPYSLGPAPFALPTVRTQNRAQELALKAFAIQMLGIWAYRSGGTLNADTLPITPGAMWAMQSTGGILGPDVTRMDASTGRIDLARMLLVNGQQQIRDALLDTRLVDDGGTPASASEIAAKMRQNANVHIGGFARLILDLLPVVVPRAMEILNAWGLLPNLMSFNQLLLSMQVTSPMTRSLRAGDLEIAGQFHQFVQAVGGPGNEGLYVSRERFIEFGRRAMSVPAELTPTPEEVQAEQQAIQQRQQMAMLAEAATKAAPQLVQAAAAPPEKMAA